MPDVGISWNCLPIRSGVTAVVPGDCYGHCCSARRVMRLAKQACILPTTATRSPPFFRHRRRSGRSLAMTKKIPHQKSPAW